MKVVVIGAGVVGVTTAYWLSRDSHDVEVLDAGAGPASQTSHANTGMVTPSQSWPWATPALTQVLVRAMLGQVPEIRIDLRAALAGLGWNLAFLRRCTERAGQQAFTANLALSHFSQQSMADIRDTTGVSYHRTAKGMMRLYTSHEGFRGGRLLSQTLSRAGVDCVVLSVEDCIAREPLLAHLRTRLAGGLFTAGDETGDCAAFSTALTDRLVDDGVSFRFNTKVTQLESDASGEIRIHTGQGVVRTGCCVVALGPESAKLLRPLGIRLPIQPVKGYSLTYRLRRDLPRLTTPIVDESRAVGLTPMGDRLRAGGFIDFSGHDSGYRDPMVAHMDRVVRDLVPDAVTGLGTAETDRWACLRPMTPDGPPLIGATAVPGLFVNTGHGSTGWTMAAGSGRLLADLLAKRPVAIGAAAYDPSRFQ